MKLIGKVNSVDRTVAKVHKDGAFEEKRRFTISARPATPLPTSYYGYGGLNFILHGQELTDFGADLNDEVEIFVVKKGGEYDKRQIEDVSAELYRMQGELDTARDTLAKVRENVKRAEERAATATQKAQALQLENVRLATQIETMRAMGFVPAENMKQIKG